MTEQINLAEAQHRCEAYAAEHGLTPPKRLLRKDGALSRDVKRFQKDSGLTLDWIFMGEGRKHWRAIA